MKGMDIIRVVLFGCLLFFGALLSPGLKLIRNQKFYNSNFNGIVSDHRIDKRSGFDYINLTDEEVTLCLFDYLDTKGNKISSGDSIYKLPCSVNIYLVKNGEIIYVTSSKCNDMLLFRRKQRTEPDEH